MGEQVCMHAITSVLSPVEQRHTIEEKERREGERGGGGGGRITFEMSE